ncbi:MAG: GGDEF domain-containing protein [Pseudobutyrivibrio sp.]|nr:GGDEF domain-containing protein [Pseudobutyrivibrio sp.]
MINGKKLVVLCTYCVYNAQVFSFVEDLNTQLKKNNCCLFIYAINSEIGNSGDNLAETSVFNLVPYDKADVLIIMDEKLKCPELVQSIIDKANEHNVPSVIIDGEYEGVSSVNYDYEKGFEAVVRHIIEEHKVRRPHFMAGKRTSEFSNARIKVFKKVLADNGIAFDDSMLSYGDFWSVPARAAADELLKRDKLPEAVICANDIMAINVCDVFQAAGVKIPEEVIVSGFDGIDEAFWSAPGITTAMCDSHMLADAISEVVSTLLKDGNKEIIKKWISPSFVANESCGCPRCNLDLLIAVQGLNNRFYHHQDDIHIMQNVTSRIMGGQSLDECLHYLRNPLTAHTCIVVENSCFNLECNYFVEDIPSGKKSVIFDAYADEDKIVPYDPEVIVPHLDEILEKGYPLIFNALEYMGKSPGFICYSYPRFDIIDYAKMPSLTNSMGMGIGGFVSMKYQKYLRDKIRRMYQKDALTGLYNRMAFLAQFEELKEDEENNGQPLTVIMADLNGLKAINDNCGHGAGDHAIATVAKAITDACPASALSVRFGGDEMFSFVLGECDSRTIIDDIEKELEEESERLEYTISASLGVYETIFHEELDLEEIIGLADEQMYNVKRKNKEGR